MPVTTTGRIMIVCRKDCPIRLCRLVMKYTHEIGTAKITAPMLAMSSCSGPFGDRIERSTCV